ncbi:MAG TPA: RHS repeat-associated core domain-containing protein, partial [Galbitalea sp.]|nr:RHS repeat-associated core domain-containing protein [Galbitalea sp.]
LDGALSILTAGNTYSYHYDQLGSITALTSSSGGIEWTYTYEPFGTPRTTTKVDPNAPTNPLGYTGQYQDPTTNLLDLRARQYDPGTGRFLTTDPKPAGPTSPYEATYDYANQDPINRYDPSGQEGETHPGMGGIGSFSEAANDARSGYITAADQSRKYGIEDPYTQSRLKPYKRPSGATTKEQREGVQGQPCAVCGADDGAQRIAGHLDPLVKQYYEHGGTFDMEAIRSPGAVRPECRACSNAEGGRLSHYSRSMKAKLFGK